MKTRLPRVKTFLGAPIDECALHAKAIQHIQGDSKSIDSLLAKHSGDSDLSTSILYNHILQSKHQPFIQTVNTLPSHPLTGPQDIKFLIVPSLFYKEYPEIGGDGALARDILLKNGFETEIINIFSAGSIQENKTIIKSVLTQQTHPKIWLISISKGTADLRACLQDFDEDELPRNIKGWVNLSGVFEGSVLVEHRISHLWKRILLRIGCKLTGINYQLLPDLLPNNPCWKQDMAFLKNMDLIHVVGFPIQSHVQHMLMYRFKTLAQSGPTDGVIRLLNTLKYPGHLYPIWGCDHYLRSTKVSELLYKLCHYVNQK